REDCAAAVGAAAVKVAGGADCWSARNCCCAIFAAVVGTLPLPPVAPIVSFALVLRSSISNRFADTMATVSGLLVSIGCTPCRALLEELLAAVVGCGRITVAGWAAAVAGGNAAIVSVSGGLAVSCRAVAVVRVYGHVLTPKYLTSAKGSSRACNHSLKFEIRAAVIGKGAAVCDGTDGTSGVMVRAVAGHLNAGCERVLQSGQNGGFWHFTVFRASTVFAGLELTTQFPHTAGFGQFAF